MRCPDCCGSGVRDSVVGFTAYPRDAFPDGPPRELARGPLDEVLRMAEGCLLIHRERQKCIDCGGTGRAGLSVYELLAALD